MLAKTDVNVTQTRFKITTLSPCKVSLALSHLTEKILTVNGIWGRYTSLLQDFFVKNIGKFYSYDFLALLLKCFWLTFEVSSCPRELSRDLFSTGGKQVSIFFHGIFMVARSYPVITLIHQKFACKCSS